MNENLINLNHFQGLVQYLSISLNQKVGKFFELK